MPSDPRAFLEGLRRARPQPARDRRSAPNARDASSSMRSDRPRRLRTSEEGHVFPPPRRARAGARRHSLRRPRPGHRLSCRPSSPRPWPSFSSRPSSIGLLLKYPSFGCRSAGFAILRHPSRREQPLRYRCRRTTADRLANRPRRLSSAGEVFLRLATATPRRAAAHAKAPVRAAAARGSTGRAAPCRRPARVVGPREAAAQGAPGLGATVAAAADRRPRGGAGGRARLRPLPRDRRPRRGGRDARRGPGRCGAIWVNPPGLDIYVLALVAHARLRRCSAARGVTAHQRARRNSADTGARGPCRRARDFIFHTQNGLDAMPMLPYKVPLWGD